MRKAERPMGHGISAVAPLLILALMMRAVIRIPPDMRMMIELAWASALSSRSSTPEAGGARPESTQ